MHIKYNKVKFITFEGIDGCGKTTQSKMLVEYLKKNNINSVWTREIGGTEICEKIRDIVVNNKLETISELFLILAARKEHTEKFIKPSIEQNMFVICDRYVDSSAAYQSSSELSIEDIYELHRRYLDNFLPSITFYIDVPYEVSRIRIKERSLNNKFDYLDKKFFNSLKENYRKIIEKFPTRFIKIDGNQEIEEIHQTILEHFKKIYF